jgi:dUTP pyrophosphatase
LTNETPTPVVVPVELKVLDARLSGWGLPAYQTAMAAAIDLCACIDEPLHILSDDPAILIPAGFAIHINDPNLAAVILPRSGTGHKRGLVLGNGTGLIDADYTGPIMISIWNRNPFAKIVIQPGERIAQMVFLPIVRARFDLVEAFSKDSARGAGGFGSTG